jgi:hypothetical protein
MPLPEKLSKKAPKSKKKAVMAEAMHELKHAPVKAPSRKATSGTKRNQQDIAIGLQQAGLSHKKENKKKK